MHFIMPIYIFSPLNIYCLLEILMLEYIKYAKCFYLSYFSPFSFLQCELMKYAMA